MATRTISTKLAIDGEAQYKQAITNINSNLKMLSSELKLAESNFKGNQNSMEALSAKGKALQDVFAKQKTKVSELEAALANAKKAQNEHSNSISEAKNKISATESQLEKLKSSTGDTTEEEKLLTEQLKAQKTELETAQSKYTAAEKGVNNWQTQLNNAKIDLNGLGEEIKKNNTYLDEAKNSADKCASSIDGYGKEIKQTGAETEQSAQKTSEFESTSSNAIGALAGAMVTAGLKEGFVAIKEAIIKCLDAAEQFESGMAKIASLTGGGIESLGNMADEITKMSNQMGESTADIAEATYQAISAGIDAADATTAVETATKLAIGGFTDSATAVDILTTAINAYGMSAEDASYIADILITTQNLGKTTVDELAQSMGKVIPLASSYGVELDNLSAAYATLTANGINTAESSTLLKAMIKELGDTGSNVSQVLTEKTGASFSELMSDGKSLGDVIAILSDHVNGNTAAFAGLWSSTEASTGALSILNTGADKYNQTLTATQESTGATSDAYETMANTSERAGKRLEASITNLKAAIGSQLAPAITKIKKSGADAFEWAADLVKKRPEIVGAISAVAAVLGVLTVAVGAYTIATKLVIPAVLAFNAALAENPLGAVALAVTVVVAAISALIIATQNESTAAEELNEKVKETKKEYKELAEAHEENLNKLERESTATVGLASTLETLIEKENKTAAEKSTIAELVDQLNESIPELNLAYDEQADTLKDLNTNAAVTAESIVALAKAEGEAAAIEEKRAALVDAYKEQAIYQSQLEEATAGLAVAQESLNHMYETSEDPMLTYGDEYTKLIDDTRAYNDTIGDLNEHMTENQAEIDGLTDAVGGLTDAQNDAAYAVGDLSKLVEENTDLSDIQATQYVWLINHIQEYEAELDNLQVAYDDAKASALDSLQSQYDLMDNVTTETSVSVSDLIENLQSQQEAFTNYSSNLAWVAAHGLSGDLIAELSTYSEEHAAILQGIVDDGGASIDEINSTFAGLQDVKLTTADTMADVQTQFSTQFNDINAKMKQAEKTLTENFSDATEQLQGAFSDCVESLNQEEAAFAAGVNDINGVIRGVNSKLSALEATYYHAAVVAQGGYARGSDQHSPSKKGEKLGGYDIEGVIVGAEKESQNLYATMRDIAVKSFAAYEAQAAQNSEAVETAIAYENRGLPEVVTQPSYADTSAAVVNAISTLVVGQQQSAGAGGTSELVININGVTLARSSLDDFIAVAKQRGKVINI